MGKPQRLLVEPTAQPRGLRLRGEIDLSNADQLSALLDPLLEDGGSINLDLSGVTFMDSTGLRVLLLAVKSVEGRGKLIIFHPAPVVQNVLRLIRAESIPNLEIVADQRKAKEQGE